MTMDTSLVNKEALDGHYSVKQPVAPKRSFDVAFLTGNHEDSDDSSSHVTSSNNNKKASKSYCCTDSTATTVINNQGDNGSAFTKVAPKREFSPRTSPVTNLQDNQTDDDTASMLTGTANPFLMPPHLATSLSLQFFQNHSAAAASKGLAMSLFGPAASQLLQTRPYSALFMAAASAGGCNLRGGNESYFPSGAKLLRSEPPAPAVTMAYSAPALNSSPLDPRLGNIRGGTGGPGPMGLFPGTTLPNPQVLPSSLAALSAGTAQNMCAKCNLSFRMTSDLVYHMRSQHRQDTSNKEKQRRQEKLRCPVCGESFRERHHLTRHMTSHEDREANGK